MNFYKQKAIKFQFFISLFYSLSHSAASLLSFPASERASDTTIKLLFCALAQLFLLLLLPYFFSLLFSSFPPFRFIKNSKVFFSFPLSLFLSCLRENLCLRGGIVCGSDKWIPGLFDENLSL